MTLSSFSSLEIDRADILVVGGGMAGASAAWELSAFAKVILLEREEQCGYHATGRSAASFTENYGSTTIRRLAMASRAFLEHPPEGFCEHPLMKPRGMITIAREDQLDLLDEELDRARQLVPSIRPMEVKEALDRVSVLRPDYVAAAIIEPDSREIDVNGLHQGFLRGARKRGARVITGAGVQAISRQGGEWIVDTGKERYGASILVNAAGAWADGIAAMADVSPVGLTPLRRTAFNIPMPEGVATSGWPLVNDVGGEFYFKPDAAQIFVSPADATPSEPVDAYAEDIDVAIGVDRLEKATTLKVDRVTHSWAGLRTFAADGSPVVGFDPVADGFFWLAGQGGYGIKTAAALARTCAELIRFQRLPADIQALGVQPDELAPARLMHSPSRETTRTGINA
ncbi:NAD(P)/FAD-dependent oxidoreductase [Aquamicrobium soli]|uniref:NAD(P)/FAD-dependent oxidoreductase n=1 Tax=Aquamicrobium soli TaxID=1811518 RepID=A0ABV7KAK0_9HYPH